jgi:hypothetical protein
MKHIIMKHIIEHYVFEELILHSSHLSTKMDGLKQHISVVIIYVSYQ